MPTVTDNRESKQQQILDCAVVLIGETGDAGLTMRKLADRAGMRLSNLQYYFRSKDDVLAGLVESYFGACEESLVELAASCAPLGRRERAHRLISEVLKHGDEVSDMCRVFRELWAIATRNAAVRAALHAYYQRFCAVIAAAVLADDGPAQHGDQVAALLVPYFEGYSIIAPSLSLSREQVAELLTAMTMALIEAR